MKISLFCTDNQWQMLLAGIFKADKIKTKPRYCIAN
ncbi:hypothetical protein SAMN05192529_10182 [Arachidicoccus rhizosphaerae]|jgi:hypothetical protein|uniref:Uncharacterized protein n=1 Tax=Arachidicoccus rhizosphaerae TaxID=551991 RepID=A0A1H3VHX7_9BACT|nr:hypothetical protein SAMN05192529_10182 [Arachidicoccus rhizosphaerae]